MVQLAPNSGHGCAWDGMFRAGAVLTLAALMFFGERSPANGATRTDKIFGKWEVVCLEPDNQEKSCSMVQTQVAPIKGSNKTRLVLRFAITSTKKDNKQVVVVPAGVSTQEGIRLFLGEAAPIVISYSYCGPKLCIASLPVDAKAIAAIKASQKASASYVLGSKKLVQIQLDLNGFGEAYDYLVKQLS